MEGFLGGLLGIGFTLAVGAFIMFLVCKAAVKDAILELKREGEI